jgi:hypothetical protein
MERALVATFCLVAIGLSVYRAIGYRIGVLKRRLLPLGGLRSIRPENRESPVGTHHF